MFMCVLRLMFQLFVSLLVPDAAVIVQLMPAQAFNGRCISGELIFITFYPQFNVFVTFALQRGALL